jgi:hypothetical protein
MGVSSKASTSSTPTSSECPRGKRRTPIHSSGSRSSCRGTGSKTPRAIEDGDRAYAVIEGSAVGTGTDDSGLTVPSATAQARTIADALADARVDPTEVPALRARHAEAEVFAGSSARRSG